MSEYVKFTAGARVVSPAVRGKRIDVLVDLAPEPDQTGWRNLDIDVAAYAVGMRILNVPARQVISMKEGELSAPVLFCAVAEEPGDVVMFFVFSVNGRDSGMHELRLTVA